MFARTIETDGTSSDSSITTIIQNFEPRSENPNVEMGGNLTTNEFQGQSDYSSQKLGIGDLQVDMAENLELMRATVKFFDDTGQKILESKTNEIEKKIKDLESPSLPAKKLHNKVKFIDGVACYLKLINQKKKYTPKRPIQMV